MIDMDNGRAEKCLHIRIAAKRKAAYEEAAARANTTLSKWVRSHLDAAVPRLPGLELNRDAARLSREVETRIHAALGRLPLAEQWPVLERIALDVPLVDGDDCRGGEQ